MKKNNRIIQFFLISIGFLLIAATYFIYPNIKENKALKETAKEKNEKILSGKTINTFENVEYKGLYNIDKPFSVQSKKALINEEDPNIIHMDNMKVILHLKDNRTIIITSLKGSYNKVTHDCYFVSEVRATDGEIVVLADNLDLLASEDNATVYNNVTLTSENGSLIADKVDYNFEKQYYKISMFNDKKVKIKLIE
tara:strand:+ start:151 stop:738 length:588 start_codon:yes stop_codon:yes gene_type:complete